MVEFTFVEYADMHFVYGECGGNAAEAVRRYRERFPERRLPNRRTFTAVQQRLRETGSVLPRPREVGRERQVNVLNAEIEILDAADADPGVSTRQLAQVVGVSPWTVWKILKENLLYPYHIQRVQNLEAADYLPRINFCRLFLQKTQ